jgi:hypothetical protein
LLRETDAQLMLYVRNGRRLKNVDPSRARVVEGDVLDAASPHLEVRRSLGVSKPWLWYAVLPCARYAGPVVTGFLRASAV